MTLIKRGFTLVELMVVMGILAILLGALTTSVSGARERARIERAKSEVKVISQAILSYENYTRGGKNELPNITSPQECDAGTLSFLLGKEASDSGEKIPTLLMAQLKGGGKMLDPWGRPYKVTIKEGTFNPNYRIDLQTGFCMPNYYRLGWEERQ